MNAEISSVTIGQETLCPDAEKVLSNNDGLSVFCAVSQKNGDSSHKSDSVSLISK